MENKQMKITRESLVTGEKHTRELNIRPQELLDWIGLMSVDVLAFRDLNVMDRIFFFTGTTPSEYKKLIANNNPPKGG